MENEKKIRVAITHGDTNGVGYELILKAFEDASMLELCTPIIYGSPQVAAIHAKALNMDVHFNIINDAQKACDNRLNLLNCFEEKEIPVELGQATAESGQAALQALDRALEDYKQGLFDVLVTAPVNRSTTKGFHGHAEYIAHKLGINGKTISLLAGEELRVALVTNNLAIKDIAESLTRQKIVEKGKLLHEAMRRDLRISSPRIAVLSLNPRCGEDGALGDEEKEIVAPAISELEEQGIQAFGPYAADGFFGRADYYDFDAVLAMYHDQGMVPFKSLAAEEGVRLTSGLSLVRTAPAGGVSFPLAGRGQTDPCAMRHAIYLAIDVFRNRINYDEPLKNPLPKLYHEKRDESEKVRFRSAPNKEQAKGEEAAER